MKDSHFYAIRMYEELKKGDAITVSVYPHLSRHVFHTRFLNEHIKRGDVTYAFRVKKIHKKRKPKMEILGLGYMFFALLALIILSLFILLILS